MRESRVYVGVQGPTLTAEAVSRRLGCEPTRAWRPGDRRGASTLVESDHGWQLESGLPQGMDLEAHLEWASQVFGAYVEQLRAMTTGHNTRVQLVITTYSDDEANLSLELAPDLLALLARAGASVWLDTYSV